MFFPIPSVASVAAQMKFLDFSLALKRKINFHLIEQEVTKYYHLLCDTVVLSSGLMRHRRIENKILECISTQINREEN